MVGQYATVSANVINSAATTILNSRYFLWTVLALPLAWMANGLRDGDLIYGEIIHASGEVSARLLLLSLAVTPLRLFFSGSNWPNWLLRRRRYFGIAAFVYAAMHTLVYLDRKIGSGLLLQEAADFSMWTGWLALALLVPLAVTSNDASVRRLRRAWKKLHRWVYLAALLTFTHWIFVAFDFVPGLIHFLVLLVLEAYRIWKRRQLKLLSVAAPAEK
ncbi:MAG: ferric reductase-like transmembrane domain-containing protein [Gammaproteobacteria bacterium]|nr:ferric reductase-like transmembrane domain-containing protein [Gammaproteobacteria bacterium]